MNTLPESVRGTGVDCLTLEEHVERCHNHNDFRHVIAVGETAELTLL